MDNQPVRILVVDDEPDLELLIRQKFRKKIRSEEISFLFAGDGFEALETLKNGAEVDIVLTDINMPRMDGLSLLSRIQDLDRLLKVVIVSAYGDMDNIRTAMNRGAFDFITKPINFDDLEITIAKTHLELEQLRKASHLQQKLSALHRELEIASKIQLSSLPSKFPAFPDRSDLDLYAMMIPAQEVGGDFYDFFLVDDDRLAFLLGDVSGKGIGAALFMAITRTMIRATGLQGLSPADCLCHVNRVLFPETMPRMFVTAIYGILDTRTGEATFCSAGHHAPLIVRKNGTVQPAERAGGLGLCLIPEFGYTQGTIQMEKGDRILLYTDGVTEAINNLGEQFDDTRLIECLNDTRDEGPAEMIRDVLRSVMAFSGGLTQADDITMLALQYNGRD